MIIEPRKMTVGLFKKNEDNELEDYDTLNLNGIPEWIGGPNIIGDGMGELV